jgi:hypothetical protein
MTDTTDTIVNEALSSQSDEYYWWISNQQNIRYYEALVSIRHIYPSNDSRYYKWLIENSLWRQQFQATITTRKIAPEEFDKNVRNIQLRIANVHVVNTIGQPGINPPAVNDIDADAGQH